MSEQLPVDIVAAMSIMVAVQQACGFDPDWVTSFRHDGPPKSKARARVVVRHGKSTAFTPPETRAAEDALAWKWKSVLQGKTHDGPLAVVCVFFRPNRQRIDVDNMTKLVLDAGTKARVWLDDSQVVMIVARVEYDPKCPRTEIALSSAGSTLDRTKSSIVPCKGCGTEFRREHLKGKAQAAREWCTTSCYNASSRPDIICVACGKSVTRRSGAQRFCSSTCGDSYRAASFSDSVARGKRRGPPLCEKCGGRVSRREYKRCSNCSPTGRKKGSKNVAVMP